MSDSFLGTSEARAGLWHVAPDRITLWRYRGDDALSLTRDGKAADFEGLYDRQKLTERDQFSVFLGGNCGTLVIEDGVEKETLLVIRDSFASPLLPFLARHFRVVAVDPRYEKHDLAALLSRADRVLVLCGEQTIGTEPFLR